ncbi:LOW QUALITY PROTEIN: uncharacterized protein LOC120485906 [Pimephales promelas]|uniref:LOW QUALITY PROTEIN: uncharacterized protein LOC120485906 n=1 Tax=Pimephales promelas TaxID=90988 RepID=UPI0019558728|nr:LOW QUALITY PROTEIN: uncharacterized protein LOC120485906 [Pimephales promelas]
MAERLERLHRKRRAVRGSTTRLLQDIETEVSKEDPVVDRLCELLAMLSAKEETLLELDHEIEEHTDVEDLENEVVDAEEYGQRVISAKARVRRVMQRVRENTDSRPRDAVPAQRGQTVKLPKLIINKFSGDISLWQDFWNQFETAIHRNDALSKTEKFNYLKTYVAGAASKAIAGLMLTDSNYDHAIDLLQNRFGRKDLLINAHMTKLLNLCPVKKSYDVSALRQLYDECEVQIRSLESLGVASEAYGSLLCPVLLQMIPEDIALQYSRQRGSSDEWKVSEVMEFLQNEILSRERTMQLIKSGNSKDSQRYHKPFKRPETLIEMKQKKHNIPSAAVLQTSSQKIPNCLFCDSAAHKTELCTVTEIAARKAKLMKLGRCFVCLGQKHIARFCKAKVSCTVCGGRHHSTVCEKGETTTSDIDDKDDVVSSFASHSVKMQSDKQNTVLLQTVRAWAEGPGGRKSIRCLLDGGSQRSFISENTVRALKLPVMKQETFTLHTFGSTAPATSRRNTVKVTLQSIWNKDQKVEVEALETPQVCTAVMKIPGEHIQAEMKRKGLQLADYQDPGTCDTELSLLIGADYYWHVVSGQVERITDALVAVESIFGWSVQGPVTMSSVSDAACMHIHIDEDTLVSERLKAFWETESLGITMQQSNSPEEEDALRMFEKTTQYKNGRYEVELPWRPDKPELPDNYRIAKKRFEGLKRRLRSDVVMYHRYNEVVNDYLQQGIVEDVVENGSSSNAVKYYMPHHAVLREDKVTTKLRVVFDASSHEVGVPSLNDCLLTGPNLNPDLLGILIKFRLNEIAFTADIEKAFLQISLAETDRDAVRFLWFTALPHEDAGERLRVLRMTRVVFGVSPSPFLLAATVRRHLKEYEHQFPEVVRIIRESLYVDDLISSASDVENAFHITTGAKEIMSAAGMNLCKWTTNCAALKEKWKETMSEPAEETETHGSVLKVLGLVWRTQTDEFVFDLTALLDAVAKRENTKRSVLKLSARIFDPIGFLTPFTVRVKCLFQELWIRGLGWDEELPSDLAQEWQGWCAELPQIHHIHIPRWYGSKCMHRHNAHQLHVFCDASEKAYSTVAYLLRVADDGTKTTCLVASKSRVAPLKKISLPRLELMGAVIGARLGNSLLKPLNMELHQVHMWTDSMIVLQWIRSPAHKWKQFVANRVSEIQLLTNPEMWSHCRSKFNPADLPTRGLTVANLKESEIWWNGPSFLTTLNPLEESEEETSDEIVVSELTQDQQMVQLSSGEKREKEPVVDLMKYSKLKRVLRVTAWIKRFVHNASSSSKMRGELTADEMFEAEKYWIKLTQERSFSPEISSLKAGKTLNADSKIRDLRPFLDEDELLCVGGRLQQSDFSYREKHPWILPNKDRYCELLVQYNHEFIMHSGLRDTLVQTRSRYWILRARQIVKGVLSKCTVCKRFKVKPAQQDTAPLPRDRVSEKPPFEVTGIDFAGPLYVKGDRALCKAYVALFTCAVTRAVHLELVSSQSTESFLLALKRFISRRGLCKVIYSDNAKTFKRANQDLSELWKAIKDPQILEYFSGKGITWRFIVERAAWWGGFWERLVRSVKMSMRKVLGKASLTFEEMSTLLAEVEAILNSRPLTFVHNELDEPQPLTPAHFLVGERLTSLPPKPFPADYDHPTVSKGDMTRRWRYRNRLMTNLWNRWRRDYLLDLKSAHSCNTQKPTQLKMGDVVLIGDVNMPRQTWKLGKIEELFPGRDGKVRSCALRTSTGTVLKRPVQLLYALEI